MKLSIFWWIFVCACMCACVCVCVRACVCHSRRHWRDLLLQQTWVDY